VSFDSEAGTRYYVVAFDFQDDGGGNGGTLHIAFTELLRPDLNFSVHVGGSVDAGRGSATLSGRYTCTAGADFAIFVDARQGRVVGGGDFTGACDGSPQRWTVVVEPERGKFTEGKLKTTSFGVASTIDLGVGYEIKQKVKLRGDRK
jgi:hypothetical protein